uniref:CCR4-NOT transcription complex subunit 10 n=1 Tax=Strigamia maritima TaxID=126957 RepID=T1J4Y2_STRMM
MSEKEDQESVEKTVSTSALPSITDREKELAQTSYGEFMKGNYDSCLQILNQLSSTRPSDSKVTMNKSVTKFYISCCTNIDEFRESMAQIRSQTHVNSRENDDLDDVDHCVVKYNQALLLYHFRKYHAAIPVLDKVFQFIEPIEENLAKKVCFLLFELYLSTYQTEKALNLIGYMEATYGNQNLNDSKTHTSDSKEKEKTAKDNDNNSNDNGRSESYKLKLQQYKTRLYLMLKSMKACKREIKSLMNSYGVTLSTIYLKSNLEYLRGNYRKALKLLNSAPQPTQSSLDSGESLSIMFCNNIGCIHFYMGKSNLGSYYFHQALQENDKVLETINKSNESAKEKSCIYVFGASRHYEILYNLGIQLLHAHKPLQAFDCLMEAIRVYPGNIRLWLRLAECCIMENKPNNADDFQLTDRQKNIVQGLVGTGHHRKIILTPSISKQNGTSENQSAAMPMPTLEFASLCLKNALILHQNDSQTNSNLSTTVGSDDMSESNTLPHDGSQCISGLPGNPIRGIEIINLRSSILVASSYVSLCLRDTVMGLHYAQTLLALPKICGIHKLLGHLYAAEALILLDRISEALDHLNPDHIKDVPLTLHLSDKEEKEKPQSQQEVINLQNWYPNSSAAARNIMHYNMTVAYALRGEYEKASETLKKVMGVGVIGNSRQQNSDVPVQAVLLALYIHLQQGNF